MGGGEDEMRWDGRGGEGMGKVEGGREEPKERGRKEKSGRERKSGKGGDAELEMSGLGKGKVKIGVKGGILGVPREKKKRGGGVWSKVFWEKE